MEAFQLFQCKCASHDNPARTVWEPGEVGSCDLQPKFPPDSRGDCGGGGSLRLARVEFLGVISALEMSFILGGGCSPHPIYELIWVARATDMENEH